MVTVKKRDALLASFLLLFILAACEAKGPVVTNTGGDTRAFIGGDKGLDISFLSGSPPDKVYDKSDAFDVNVRLENVGEWDIMNTADVTVRLTGIDPASFGKTAADFTKNSPEALDGVERDASGNPIQGDIVNVEYTNLMYAHKISSVVELPIRADVCYSYGTKVNSKLCILEDLAGARRKSTDELVCNPDEAKSVENSGAPVQVTSFREAITGTDKVRFTFDIDHKAATSGDVFRKGTRCSGDRQNEDFVYVKVNTGIPGLSCSSLSEGDGATEGYVRMTNEKRTVTCTQELASAETDYEKSVTIELTYDYKGIVTTNIVVEHLE